MSNLKTTSDRITEECDAIKTMLITKNKAYGDSASKPMRVFSRANKEEALLVRLDDKLSRLARGDGSISEDTIQDLIGYLVLLRVVRAEMRAEATVGTATVAASAVKPVLPIKQNASQRVILMAFSIICSCGASVLLTETIPQVRCRNCGELYSSAVYDGNPDLTIQESESEENGN